METKINRNLLGFGLEEFSATLIALINKIESKIAWICL